MKDDIEIKNDYLKPNYVAKKMGLSTASVYNLAHSGIIPAIFLGRSIRIPRIEFEEFLANGGKRWGEGWRKEEPAAPIVRESGRSK